MKTRTLLLLAVACGLVILVAGSIKLFLVADTKEPAHLAIGQSAAVGDMHVTVASVDRTAAETLVTVSLVGVDDNDGALSWTFVTGTKQLAPHAPPAGDGAACGATQQSTSITCVLAFDTTETVGVLRYDRAGETRRWDVTGKRVTGTRGTRVAEPRHGAPPRPWRYRCLRKSRR